MWLIVDMGNVVVQWVEVVEPNAEPFTLFNVGGVGKSHRAGVYTKHPTSFAVVWAGWFTFLWVGRVFDAYVLVDPSTI